MAIPGAESGYVACAADGGSPSWSADGSAPWYPMTMTSPAPGVFAEDQPVLCPVPEREMILI